MSNHIFLKDVDGEEHERVKRQRDELLAAAKLIVTFFAFFDSWCPPDLGKDAKNSLTILKRTVAKIEEQND